MHYHIDTIPIWDAVKADSECPLCLLQDQLEQKFVDFYLGDSVMESDIRIKVNQTGYCDRHYGMLYDGGEKLPLALMTHTRMNQIIEDITPHLEALAKEGKKREDIAPLLTYIENANQGCVICDRIAEHMDRYYKTIIAMVKKESEFKDALLDSRGFCMHHFGKVLQAADKHIGMMKRKTFLAELSRMQMANLQRLTGEVKWFADKFDFRNAKKDWGTSRDSLPRMLNKLGGRSF